MSEHAFQNLKWALEINTHNLETMLLDAYEDRPRYLEYIDNLISYLRAHNCKNIQEKLKCIADLFRFRSVQSELEIAKKLIERGKTVSLLPDDYAGMNSPPDIFAKDSQIEAYIEVRRIIEDPTKNQIIELLRKLLRNYPCIVNLELNEEMATPTTRYYEIEKRKRMVREVLQQLETKLKMLNLSSLPMKIETDIGKFEVLRSPSNMGYPGVLSYDIIVPKDKLIKKICYDLKEKAKKREEWGTEHKSKVYIIALDFEEWGYEDLLEEALIGSRIYVLPPLKVPAIPETDEVRHARERGWEDFLRKTNIIPSDQIYLDWSKKGVFFTESIMKNVSGVIGRLDQKINFVPNPFSYDEINDPRLVSYL